jgi:hypothetical protein
MKGQGRESQQKIKLGDNVTGLMGIGNLAVDSNNINVVEFENRDIGYRSTEQAEGNAKRTHSTYHTDSTLHTNTRISKWLS